MKSPLVKITRWRNSCKNISKWQLGVNSFNNFCLFHQQLTLRRSFIAQLLPRSRHHSDWNQFWSRHEEVGTRRNLWEHQVEDWCAEKLCAVKGRAGRSRPIEAWNCQEGGWGEGWAGSEDSEGNTRWKRETNWRDGKRNFLSSLQFS